MMDLFREESVRKVNTWFNTVVYVLAWIGMVFFGVLAIMSFQTIFGQIAQGSFTILPIILRILTAVDFRFRMDPFPPANRILSFYLSLY